jgi:hypothetical protein
MGAEDVRQSYADARQVWLSWMRNTLTGPRSGDEEEIDRSPLNVYSCGILAPAGIEPTPENQGNQSDAVVPSRIEVQPGDAEAGSAEEAESPDAVAILPSASIGLSFLVSADIRIETLVSAGVYDRRAERMTATRQPEGQSTVDGPGHADEALNGGREGEVDQQKTFRWHRIPISSAPGECIFAPPTRPTTVRHPVLDKRAEICTRWRKHGDNWLVTVSLVNRNNRPSGSARYGEELAKLCLFQTSLTCVPLEGRILPYPQLEGLLLTDEEQELELQYRSRKVFAIGHAVAADWELGQDGDVKELYARFLPAVEVPLVTTQNPDLPQEALDIELLSRCEDAPADVIGHLRKFVDLYAQWVEVSGRSDAFAEAESETASRITGRQQRAVERLRNGCDLLENDTKVRRAFSLAQRAMLDQMVHVRMAQGQRPLPSGSRFRWRPFQIAFLLLALESVIDQESEDRDLVDLLWFPTGGGKTEAYLALIAVLVLYRRLRWPGSGGGTTVIMRYTLRLLTAQQFQRATALICALERIRRELPDELGAEPITGGLWVGGASTPNRNADALKILGKLQRGQRSDQSLFLEQCPWCGTPLAPSPLHPETNIELGIRAHGEGIQFFCTSTNCDFHGGLPLHVVDEHLYSHPPTLLLATVDKFARLTWEERASAFLGHPNRRPPEVVIQDELHLIAGPLGSFAGIYEAALDTVLQYRGIRPKYIASTATIRHAAKQVRVLYGREMAVFPPPGHTCDDSFFARTDWEKPGRLYVGLCGDNPFLSWRETLAHAAGAALAVPGANGWTSELRDAWWTLVIYHGSLRGVGQSHRLAAHEIPEILGQLLAASEQEPAADGDATDPGAACARILTGNQVVPLTSQVDAAGIQDVLRRLQKPFSDPESVSLVLCTNMLSVGIDISRLALMIVNGQPLTTAEYIQASSRVGRDLVPGIVLAHYNRRRPRDLSHFENFRPYHDSFYRFVEPTSVTPFSAPARYRALHAAVVILLRHGIDSLLRNEDAFHMVADDGAVQKALSLLIKRCGLADASAAGDVEEQVRRLIEEWDNHKQKALRYQSREPQLPGLLRNVFEHPDKGLWETMQSMRSVDRMSELRVMRPYRLDGEEVRDAAGQA